MFAKIRLLVSLRVACPAEIRNLVRKSRNLFTKIRFLVSLRVAGPVEMRYLVNKSRNLFTKMRLLVRFERDCLGEYVFWPSSGNL